MTQSVERRNADDRQAASGRPAPRHPEFKPVALPALVAAVRSVGNGAQPRKPNPRDLPAILREDALLG